MEKSTVLLFDIDNTLLDFSAGAMQAMEEIFRAAGLPYAPEMFAVFQVENDKLWARIERGELTPEDFMAEITAMLKELVGTYQVIKGSEYLFAPPREVVGKCPRCGGEVAELQKGFFCQNDSCKFAIWKNNKWWAAKKKQPTKAVVSALLNDGRVRVTGLYSEKTGKTYDATVVLEDDGQYANFKLEFDQRKGGSR